MRMISCPVKYKKGVVIIGVFDGLHLGHQFLIRKAVAQARKLKKKSLCLTFFPHPQRAVSLISVEHRIKIIKSLGIDYVKIIPFNKKFANIKAEKFIGLLAGAFKPEYIFVGKNFRFGRNQEGDVSLLKKYAKSFGYNVRPQKELKIGGMVISSNIIRGLINSGRLRDAERFLGRRVTVLGTVVPGHKRGRDLGFPTANVDPHHEVLPSKGVYLVRAKKGTGCFSLPLFYYGLCNIGIRPTFSARKQTIEVFLFDFKRNLYGQDIEIEFIQKLRKEKKFPSVSRLVSQIQQDIQKAKKILSKKTLSF